MDERPCMDDKPPTVPEEVETAKTTDTVPTDDTEGEAPKDKETDKKEGESTEKAIATVPDEAAAEPLAVADGDKDQKQPSDEGDGPKGDAATDVADKPSDGDDKTEKTAVGKEAEVAPSDAVDSEKPAIATKEGESEAALVAPSDASDSEKPATTTKESESEVAPVAVNFDYLKSEFIGSSDDAASVPRGDLLDDVAKKIPEELSTALAEVDRAIAPPPTLPPPPLPKGNARSPFHEARRSARKSFDSEDEPIADASTPDSHSVLRCSVASSSDGSDGKGDIGPLIGHVQSLRDEVKSRALRAASLPHSY